MWSSDPGQCDGSCLYFDYWGSFKRSIEKVRWMIMKKENFSTISDRFLDKAYGKSKEELLYMYQNDRQFRADYEAVKQHINDVLLPVLKEVYEAIEATIKEIAEGIAEWAKQNPDIINALQKNGVKNSLEFGA